MSGEQEAQIRALFGQAFECILPAMMMIKFEEKNIRETNKLVGNKTEDVSPLKEAYF